MIRIGFVNVFAVQEWLGGLNYLRNLLQAVAGLEGRRIEPVLFAGTGRNAAIDGGFASVQVRRTAALERGHPLWALRKLVQRISGSDPVLERVLAADGIAVLSHSGDLGRGASIPAIGWVPDLQHRHLAHLFSEKQIALRDRQIRQSLAGCARMIASSEAAANDLRAFSPEHRGKIRVLHFASGLHEWPLPGRGELEARYGIDGMYLHLPNQFWVHKNHEVVIEALRTLKATDPSIMVIATGRMEDPRQPDHVQNLMKRVRDHGLDTMFRALGVIPYRDMLGLMRNSVAVINPSRFEGWSTTVEEARSMGKALVLSAIPVHLEQAPPRAFYFDVDDATDAARTLREAWRAFDRARDEQAMAQAAAELPGRLRRFAQTYQEIVLEALEPNHGRVH